MGRVGGTRKPGARYPSGRLKRYKTTVQPDGSASVYVITNDALGLVKIGYSADPGLRCESLQVGVADTLRIFWAGKLRSEAIAYQLETSVHRKLRGSPDHVRGEWYSLGADEAVAHILERAAYLELRISTHPNYGLGRIAGFRHSEKPLKGIPHLGWKVTGFDRMQGTDLGF